MKQFKENIKIRVNGFSHAWPYDEISHQQICEFENFDLTFEDRAIYVNYPNSKTWSFYDSEDESLKVEDGTKISTQPRKPKNLVVNYDDYGSSFMDRDEFKLVHEMLTNKEKFDSPSPICILYDHIKDTWGEFPQISDEDLVIFQQVSAAILLHIYRYEIDSREREEAYQRLGNWSAVHFERGGDGLSVWKHLCEKDSEVMTRLAEMTQAWLVWYSGGTWHEPKLSRKAIRTSFVGGIHAPEVYYNIIPKIRKEASKRMLTVQKIEEY